MNRYTIFILIISSLWASSLQKNIDSRIVGGNPARAGQFPFAVAINSTTKDGVLFCGGSLISRRHILTAAVCIEDGEQFIVQLGANSLQGDDRYRTIDSTSEYLIHPDYNPNTLENNLGFVILRLDLTLTVGYLWFVSYLPTADLQDSEPVIALGWGQISDNKPGPENSLNYVQQVAISNTECKLTYGDQLKDNMVCASGNFNEGTCIGDTGGPLVQDARLGLMRQVAVASFVSGNGCEAPHPSGYTRIYPYISWIRSVTGRDD